MERSTPVLALCVATFVAGVSLAMAGNGAARQRVVPVASSAGPSA